MKRLRFLPTVTLTAALGLSLCACAPAPQEPQTAIPYPLDTCLVSGEKLGGDPDMQPYTFVHEGQEIKLCCKSCLKDFNKDPGKYLAKLQPAQMPAGG